MATDNLASVLTALREQVLARNNLVTMLARVEGVDESQRNLDEKIDRVRRNTSFQPFLLDERGAPTSGFSVRYVDSSPRRAQRICVELTAMTLEEDLKTRSSQMQSTFEFLHHQIDLAHDNLKKLDAQVSACGSRRAQQSREDKAKCEQLVRDRKLAQDFYKDLLRKAHQSEISVQLGTTTFERFRVLEPASLPDTPDFPNRILFAGAGMGVGVLLGIILARRLT